MTAKLALIFGVILLLGSFAKAQQFSLDAFDVAPPTLVEELKAIKRTTPDIGAEAFAEKANVVLQSKGVPFSFIFDDAVCDSIKTAIAKLKDQKAPKNLRTKLSSVGGDPAELRVPPADFANSECAKCTLTLPIFEITDSDFISQLHGVNIKFERPPGLRFGETILIDEKDPSRVKVRWKIPFRGKPLGVSYDGGVLYMAFREPELQDLALLVFSEGVFQITTRADASSNGKAEEVKNAPAGTLLFKNRDIQQMLRYDEPCH